MKRLIYASNIQEFDSTSNVDYETCKQLANAELAKHNSTMHFFDNSFSSPGGYLTKFEGDSNILSIDKLVTITVDGYSAAIDGFFFRPNGYTDISQAKSSIPKEIDRYLESVEFDLKNLQSVVNMIPEGEVLAESISNKIEDYYASRFDNVEVNYSLLYPSVEPHFLLSKSPQFEFTIKLDSLEFEDNIDNIHRFETLENGEAYQRIIRSINKAIKKSSQGEFSDKLIKSLLQAENIDTTKHKYELQAKEHDLLNRGEVYTKRFVCSGDWLAYLSMALHNSPTATRVNKYFGQAGFENLIDACPTVNDIRIHAGANWYGDNDDFIIYLKNLDTDKYLYGPEEPDEEDWEDY